MAEPNAFSHAELDRGSDTRRQDREWVAAQRHDPEARAVVASSAGVLVADGRLALVPLAGLADARRALLLGRDALGPVFAYDEEPPAPDGAVAPMVGAPGRRGDRAAKDGGERVALREAAVRLPLEDGGLAAYAAALLNWHRRHRFCANCGHATGIEWGGLVRVCPHCTASHHPRTDPVVIMLVIDGDRALLGRQPSWPPGRYSALAGFVAPGETLEEAVAREVEEEARVQVGASIYLSSQPWPFPSSLMLGFHVPWVSGEPDASDEELQDARWYSRAEIEAAASNDTDDWEAPSAPDGGLRLPPRMAIARRLIDAWLGG